MAAAAADRSLSVDKTKMDDYRDIVVHSKCRCRAMRGRRYGTYVVEGEDIRNSAVTLSELMDFHRPLIPCRDYCGNRRPSAGLAMFVPLDDGKLIERKMADFWERCTPERGLDASQMVLIEPTEELEEKVRSASRMGFRGLTDDHKFTTYSGIEASPGFTLEFLLRPTEEFSSWFAFARKNKLGLIGCLELQTAKAIASGYKQDDLNIGFGKSALLPRPGRWTDVLNMEPINVTAIREWQEEVRIHVNPDVPITSRLLSYDKSKMVAVSVLSSASVVERFGCRARWCHASRVQCVMFIFVKCLSVFVQYIHIYHTKN